MAMENMIPQALQSPLPPNPQNAEVILSDLDDLTLANHIAELAAHLDAATYRLLCLIGEYDRRDAWVKGGFRSTAHWLTFHVGIDAITAREKVRVARVLPQFPLISEAFKRGQISYSKVRAITRVANPSNERDILAIAKAGTANHVERVVRGYRKATKPEEERADDQEKHQARYVHFSYDAFGMLLLEARLPEPAGAVVLKALEAALAMLDVKQEKAPDDAKAEAANTCSSFHDNQTEMGLPLVATPEASAEGEEPSSAFARNNAEAAQTNSSKAVNASAEALPAPKLTTSLSQRRADALVFVAEAALSQGLSGSQRHAPYQVVLHVDAEMLTDPEIKGQSCIEDGSAISLEGAKRLMCDASIVPVTHHADGTILDVGRRTRKISARLWQALICRDEHCVFPGCERTQHLKAHHIRHWGEGGPTDRDNIVLLCSQHHFLVHEGGFAIKGQAPNNLSFFDPEGHPIQTVVLLPVIEGDPVQFLREQHEELGLYIDEQTNRILWSGERLDLDFAVSELLYDANHYSDLDRDP